MCIAVGFFRAWNRKGCCWFLLLCLCVCSSNGNHVHNVHKTRNNRVDEQLRMMMMGGDPITSRAFPNIPSLSTNTHRPIFPYDFKGILFALKNMNLPYETAAD